MVPRFHAFLSRPGESSCLFPVVSPFYARSCKNGYISFPPCIHIPLHRDFTSSPIKRWSPFLHPLHLGLTVQLILAKETLANWYKQRVQKCMCIGACLSCYSWELRHSATCISVGSSAGRWVTHGPVTSTALAASQPSARQKGETINCRLTTNAGVSSADAT